MIKIEEIRKIIEKADNPLIFYDDDGDGLVSYCLIRRKYPKCEGTVVKGKLEVEGPYLRKIEEYKPDLVIILDKPELEQEFVDEVNVPIIWIDHHPVNDIKGVKYFNPLLENKKDNRPVSYWCYKIVNQDLWLAAAGVIGDWSLELFKEVKKEYKDLFKCKVKNPGDVIYNCRFGELIRIINFLLKGRVKDIKINSKILCRIESPYEILNKETPKGKFIFRKAEDIGKKYNKLLKEALKINKRSKLIVFNYKASISFNGDLSNELIYRYPKKVVIIGRIKEESVSMSLRSGEKSKVILPDILKKVLKEVSGRGGGHMHACGATVVKEDYNKFLELFRKNI